MGWKFWKQDRPQDTVPSARPQDVVPGAFTLMVEDVFSITGRGTVITGRVQSGSAAVGDAVTISRGGQVVLQTQIDGVEMFRKTATVANAGDNVGLLLRGVGKDQVVRGDVIGK